ncbi:MAG: IS3 family transposase [Myxococcales bacterium]|nr:IS3 family transposase [Myxococcales bacterium]
MRQDGARLRPACAALGLDPRTVQRWQRQGGGEDRRQGPKTAPKNKLSPRERARLLEIANAPENRDLTPNQLIPKLADQGIYIASESTLYRILREEKMLAHRGRARPKSRRNKPKEHVATGPCQVMSWDITYLKTTVAGIYLYLYLVIDVFSRKIMAWAVHSEESMLHSAKLIEDMCQEHGLDPRGIVLHSDNGGPMKGSTMLATLQRLGIVPSFSRPRTSDDNPFSEALFRTLKYSPQFPSEPFENREDAEAWVAGFVRWYNSQHLHSALRFVTPDDRHYGREHDILEQREAVYEGARLRHPDRWSGSTRNWTPVGSVYLNPDELPANSAEVYSKTG